MPAPPSLRILGLEALALVLAATCGGCGGAGTLLCVECRAMLVPSPIRTRTPGGLSVRAALPFDSVAARCIRRLKDQGETMLARPLGAALAAVLDDPEPERERVLFVPVPTSRSAFRRRGYRVPELLLRRAGATPSRLLARAGGRGDQRGLDVAARAENVRGSMRARRGSAGERVILVDDVVTTGSTVDEAARVLADAGFHVLSVAALAATPRHREHIMNGSETRRK